MPIPPAVQELVRRFDAEKAAYKGGGYNETMVRREFLDPFFAALGWDVENRAGLGEGQKEVVHEARVRVLDEEREAALKSPDYAFRLGGVRRFFVEAKKPSVNVEGNVTAAFQTRRYAWSDPDVGVAILTDFEEFAVYDGRVKPSRGDSPEKARLRYFRYDAYEAEWDWLAGLFSREAVAGGSLERLMAETGRKDRRGTETPGDAFLKEIEGWREALAREVARKHPALSARDLNGAVQRTIDRIIFLRIAEDREIEPYRELREAARGQRVYPRLVELFRAADRRYNAGLFHFGAEAGRAGTPDTLTPGLEIGNRVLVPIIEGLYYPNSPYAFKVLPVDLLGQVYERFLGKVIRLEKGQAVVEEKPEVKKAGGVFYTPTYVVEYIVRRTLGPLLEGRSVKQAEGLAVLDPACGSGSFLLGAYGFLLGWYLARYTEAGAERHARGKRPKLVAGPGGGWLLSLDEKKRILREHLYGVDLDAQAVEVTKLSLLLRLLEGETAESLGRQLLVERILPELGENVRRGNSLVEPDFYEGRDEGDEEARYRVGAFDWGAAFPAVMGRGGFDAVIGNPPYVRIQTMQQWAGPEVEYVKGCYRAAARGNFDVYVVFVERGLGLLRAGGRLGFIVPHKFFNAQYGAALRGLLAEGRHVAGVVHFGHAQVFAGATTYTALVFLAKDGADAFGYAEVADLGAWRKSLAPDASGLRREEAVAAEGVVPAERLGAAEWNVTVGAGAGLVRRLAAAHPPLGDVAGVYVGLQTSADAVYIMDLVARGEDRLRLYSEALER